MQGGGVVRGPARQLLAAATEVRELRGGPAVAGVRARRSGRHEGMSLASASARLATQPGGTGTSRTWQPETPPAVRCDPGDRRGQVAAQAGATRLEDRFLARPAAGGRDRAGPPRAAAPGRRTGLLGGEPALLEERRRTTGPPLPRRSRSCGGGRRRRAPGSRWPSSSRPAAGTPRARGGTDGRGAWWRSAPDPARVRAPRRARRAGRPAAAPVGGARPEYLAAPGRAPRA